VTDHPHSPTYSDTPTFHQPGGWGDQWRTDALSAVDWLGNTFRLGERVMYCIGAGRGQMMAVGTVKQIRALDGLRWHWDRETNTRSQIPHTTVEVQVLTEKTSGGWNNKERSKPAWVNPMNITALNNLEEAACVDG
jgi:hypothetical protein